MTFIPQRGGIRAHRPPVFAFSKGHFFSGPCERPEEVIGVSSDFAVYFNFGEKRMVSRKYVKDYHIDEQYNPVTGRLKSVPIYTGAWYAFTDPAAAGRLKKLFSALSAVSTAAYLVFLFVNAPCVHIWYCTVPLVILMIEIFFMLAALLRLLTAKDRVIHEHRDKIVDRFRSVTVLQMVFCGLALCGHLVYSVMVGDTFADYIIYGSTLIILLCAFLMFRLQGGLEMAEIVQEAAPAAPGEN